MTRKLLKIKHKAVLSLFMILLLLLPMMLSSCNKAGNGGDNPVFEAFDWNMTNEQYVATATEKINTIIEDLYPSILEQNGETKIEAVKNGGAECSYSQKLHGYDTDSWLYIELTPDLKPLNIELKGNWLNMVRIPKDTFDQMFTSLQKDAEDYGVTLMPEDVSFYMKKDELIVAAEITYGHSEYLSPKTEVIREYTDISSIKPQETNMSEAKIRKTIDPFVKQLYGINDLSDFKVSYKNNKLTYRLGMYGYETDETLTFKFSPEMILSEFTYNVGDFDRPSDYFGIVSKDALNTAFEVLNTAAGGELTQKDCRLTTNDQYLTMFVKDNKSISCSVSTVYRLAEDELAHIKAPNPSYTPDYTNLSQTLIEMRKLADQKIMDEYGIQDLSNYDINIMPSGSREFTVTYTFTICGVPTGEIYEVRVSRDNGVLEIKGNFGETSWILSYADLEYIQSRLDELDREYTEVTGLSPNVGEMHFGIETDKSLYFYRDAIIPTDYPDIYDNYNFTQIEYMFSYHSLKKTAK